MMIVKNTKFGENRSRIDRDMPCCVFSKMATADILNFHKMPFWTPLPHVLPISIHTPNLVQID